MPGVKLSLAAVAALLMITACTASDTESRTQGMYEEPPPTCNDDAGVPTPDVAVPDAPPPTPDSAVVVGCTRTPGYWKTHSSFGPAPYDSTWGLLPSGANTSFFLSGQTYYQVLWTAPRGNAYYILAHQWIAAHLNMLAGASLGTTHAAHHAAMALLATYTPAQIGALTGSSALRAQFLSLAATLDAYNNGLLGPSHCK